jgi:zinc/manganese transport system substrate-binding protein
MKRLASTLVILLALFVARDAMAKVNVVTTMQTFRAITQEIGGDKVSVVALVGDAVDPHHVDARPSYALTLNKADLLIHVGLELEKGWLPPLIEQARNPRIQGGAAGNLDISSTGIPVLDVGAGTRAQGDIHPQGNPHYWLPPDNALRIARAVADRLKALDASNAAYYEGRFKDFAGRLAKKKAEWSAKARTLAGKKVVTYHKSWTYLTSYLGMQEIGYIEPKPGVPPDPKHLAELVQVAKAQGAKIVIVESFYPRNTAQKVAELGGMKLLVLPSDCGSGQTYFALMDSLVDQLVAAAT